MKYLLAIGQRPIALLALFGVLLLGSCSKEDLVSPCGQEEEPVNTEKSTGQIAGDEVEGARNIEGATLRSFDLDGDGLPDDDGISDDGDDEGDSERNRKVKN